MLRIVKKRKRLDRFIYQALRDVVKLGGEDVIKNFEETFKRLQVEGCRKDGPFSVMYAEDMEDEDDLSPHQYTKTEIKEMETLFMGTYREARK